jgi:hypothetical protein
VIAARNAFETGKWPSTNFQQFLESQRFGDFSERPPISLFVAPIPYLGHLNRADIFLLQLNPGFNLNNYYAEWNVPAFRRQRRPTIWCIRVCWKEVLWGALVIAVRKVAAWDWAVTRATTLSSIGKGSREAPVSVHGPPGCSAIPH